MNVGIDSMVLIYAGIVPRKSEKGKAAHTTALATKAKLLLHMLRNDTVILPAVAVSEILVPVPSTNRGILTAKLASMFVCPSFDLPASAIAAELWAKHKKLKPSQHRQRQVLRADAMIVASAKAAGATLFYSHDKKCRQLASQIMEARDLPHRDPTDMFAVKDIERGEL